MLGGVGMLGGDVCWDVSGRCWEVLGGVGRCWDVLGCVLGDVGRCWEVMGGDGRCWEVLGGVGM